ncbi:MAG: HigA family addiction module antidote protein [Leptospiraceae bacterium]|nr:HigA family addiction module antidote protein [Leptospiraceae bacterium]
MSFGVWYRLTKKLHVSTSTILEILHNKRKVTVDMSLRLAKFFGMSDKFWINLQNDLEIRKQKEKLRDKLESIQTLRKVNYFFIESDLSIF